MRIALMIAVLALAACSRPAATGYAPQVEMNFMRACEAQSTTPGLCACTWDQIEANVAPSDLAALERLPGPEREASALKRQIDGYAMACNAQLAREPAATP